MEVVREPVGRQWLAYKAICDKKGEEDGYREANGGPQRVQPFPAVRVLDHAAVEEQNGELDGASTSNKHDLGNPPDLCSRISVSSRISIRFDCLRTNAAPTYSG